VVLEELLESVLGDILSSLHFVLVDVEVNACLDEQNVINYNMRVSILPPSDIQSRR
jgi:hypothetical protein